MTDIVEEIARAMAGVTGEWRNEESHNIHLKLARAAYEVMARSDGETSATVTAWVDEAFGVTDNPFRRTTRANEEMAELLTAVASDAPPSKIAEEAADVTILMHLICGRLGLDLDAAVALKMAKNRGREWAVDGTGCGYHVKPGIFPPDEDWFCESCKAVNFGIRRLCRFCKRPREAASAIGSSGHEG